VSRLTPLTQSQSQGQGHVTKAKTKAKANSATEGLDKMQPNKIFQFSEFLP